MAEIYKANCPVFKNGGAFKLTTPYGADIPDYPTKGKTGDHWGNDIVAVGKDGKSSTTDYIIAIADGVIFAQRKWVKQDTKNPPSAGNCVYIRHKNGMVSKYLHLKENTVPDWVGDNVEVKKGAVLGYMGNTGNSYGAHLHFQVETADEKTVDPLPYLLGEKIIDANTRYGISFEKEEEAEKVVNALKALGIPAKIESTEV